MISRDESVESRQTVWELAAALFLLAVLVKLQLLRPLDEAITVWLQTWRTAWLDEAARIVTFFGSSPFTLGVVAMVSFQWWRSGQRTAVQAFWRAGLLGILVQLVLRLAVAQWRPDTTMVPPATDWFNRFELAGFTSGHAFRSAFLGGWLCEALQRQRRALGVPAAAAVGLMVGLVGLTRIYLYRHWTTDVVGSWMVAALALALAARWQQGS
jgi:undecaprenyl-diphosphatase